MSNRSYPADFSRPLREMPVATDEDVQRMLERLRRRCKAGKVSINDSSGELREPNLHQAQLPDGAKPSPHAVSNIDAASSAGSTLPASPSVVSGAAAITATAGGGSNGAEPTGSFPFQPTRSAPKTQEESALAAPAGPRDGLSQEVMRSDPRSDSRRFQECVQSGNRSVDAGVKASAENTLNGPGSGCEAELVTPTALAPSAPALVWERISPYAMRTTCGTWICCKLILNAVPSYELWHRIAGLERPVCVKRGLSSFLQAQAIAQDETDRCD